MNFDTILLDKALSALNEQLEIRKTPVIEIVVCGGSALQFLGLVDRRRFLEKVGYKNVSAKIKHEME